MEQETRDIKDINVYRTPDGDPTCARNIRTKKVCIFYRAKKFGMVDTCLFAPRGKFLKRRGEIGTGWLIPGNFCPLWKS